MHDHLQVIQGPVAQKKPVTAIDIALESDATMGYHVMDANARPRKSFPKELCSGWDVTSVSTQSPTAMIDLIAVLGFQVTTSARRQQ